MKISPKSPLFVLMALSLTTHAWANTPSLQDEKEISGQKTKEVVYQSLNKSVEDKQTRAIQLINAVGSYANDRFSNEKDKEDAEYAYNGFIARFQGIREDREALERKEILADNTTLENYSKRLDSLIGDIQNFLKS